MITKETIKEHILTVPDEYVTHNQNQEKSPKQRKEKIQTKKKTFMNEPIPLSNRFSPMDIEDPVELNYWCCVAAMLGVICLCAARWALAHLEYYLLSIHL